MHCYIQWTLTIILTAWLTFRSQGLYFASNSKISLVGSPNECFTANMKGKDQLKMEIIRTNTLNSHSMWTWCLGFWPLVSSHLIPLFWPFMTGSNGLGWHNVASEMHSLTIILLCRSLSAQSSSVIRKARPVAFMLYGIRFSFSDLMHLCFARVFDFHLNKLEVFLKVFYVILYFYFGVSNIHTCCKLQIDSNVQDSFISLN